MRRGLRVGQARPEMQTSKLGREMDWLLDQWQTTSAEDRLKLVVAKIRQEEKLLQEPSKRVG